MRQKLFELKINLKITDDDDVSCWGSLKSFTIFL